MSFISEEKTQKIINEINSKSIYLIVDEKTDVLQRYVFNVLDGVPDGKEKSIWC